MPDEEITICKCGEVDCLGFVLLHEKELDDLDYMEDIQNVLSWKHGNVDFKVVDSPSSGEIFTKFYELHMIKKIKVNSMKVIFTGLGLSEFYSELHCALQIGPTVPACFDMVYKPDIAVEHKLYEEPFIGYAINDAEFTGKQMEAIYGIAQSYIREPVLPISNTILDIFDFRNMLKLDYDKPKKVWEKKRFYY